MRNAIYTGILLLFILLATSCVIEPNPSPYEDPSAATGGGQPTLPAADTWIAAGPDAPEPAGTSDAVNAADAGFDRDDAHEPAPDVLADGRASDTSTSQDSDVSRPKADADPPDVESAESR